MFKLIGVLILSVVVATAQVQNVTALSSNNQQSSSVARTDDYINLNRLQYAKTLQEYENQINKFRQLYAGRVDGIEIQEAMLIDSLVQNEERLNPQELLSDFSKECVTKYRSTIPTVAYTKSSIASCRTTATNQVNSLLTNPTNTKNSLQNYYTNYFEKEITNCGKKFDNKTANYTLCVTSVTTTTNTYTINNQKTFATQMDSADCSSNANIKKALDCSFLVINRTITQIAEVNTLINKCLMGQDDCRQCNQGYTCSDVFYLRYSEVDYKNETMRNPFYGREYLKDCLMLEINHNS
ncbi:uncharacterized protein LOC119606988 [Lucilia sericata]|uniref:uncharacterized protein LOC119606988 n=1 Tax=Lucilia sericata TaxID=13632 RepID=UPI0018A7FED1|nr:uncharacterized protein LOC119606988 [Lucilia sericata]